MTMGDMKTPDFDDLLAAFDIPDMVDPKAAIESGHDEQEGHIKQHAHGGGGSSGSGGGGSDEDAHAPSASDVGVSVIVKNVRTVDSAPEGPDKDSHAPAGNGLHNGFLSAAAASLDSYKDGPPKGLKGGDAPAASSSSSEAAHKDSSFNQFSPISSAEEFDDDEKIEVDDPPDKEELRGPGLRAHVLTGTVSQQDYDKLKALGGDGVPGKPGVGLDKSKAIKREAESNSISLSGYEPFKARKTEEKLKEAADKGLEARVNDGKPCPEKSEGAFGPASASRTKPSSKLSSCIAAIAALSAKKAASDSAREPAPSSQDPSPAPKETHDNSPRATDKSPEAPSLIDGPKKASLKQQPDSPRSISSENSSKGSPSSPAGSTPAIPKVRIKTIKTSSGEIKRTVTRVPPDVDPDSGKKSSEPPGSVVASVTSILSSPSTAAVLSSPPRAPLQSALVTNAVGPGELTPKQVTIKPVATAFLPVSAVKTAGSQVINLKLANNTTVKATVISAASVQSASSAIIKAANAIQQQTVVVPASSLANAKLVPKTVHLANLNLLPQGAQAASELRQVLTKPQQQIKQAIINAAVAQPPKKVSRVQVVSSLQSSVVDAFNKVLSSVNPVPVYIPNLSPPANAGITLPSRGYKCLECGDSFALEKSLSQHYERRSVRIEVTCNHCTKNLVFYNKCSLLSHARGHKEKGVVMQCSHLILKPVPADQMIAAPVSNTNGSPAAAPSSVLSSPGAAGTHAATAAAAKIQSGITGNVISAPSTTPITPAMPLDEDPSKLCRHSLKCLECNELFQDETSLATHFQQTAETSGQQMKKHPCRQCDKSFSSSHSLCRHNRIKHKGIRHCPDSRRTFTKRLMLEKHIQLMHGIKDPDLKEMVEATNDEQVEPKDDTKVSSPKRKLEEPLLEFRPPRGAITQPLKKLKINVFKVHKCAVCGFTTENLLQFHEHIPQHKSDGSSYQCRECGLCYTSHVSLSRHLFIVHKLKEPQPVSKQNGAGDDGQQENKPGLEDEASDGVPSDRKCKVCAKTFETEAALNAHMRTHGMAFIKSKRVSSAEK